MTNFDGFLIEKKNKCGKVTKPKPVDSSFPISWCCRIYVKCWTPLRNPYLLWYWVELVRVGQNTFCVNKIIERSAAVSNYRNCSYSDGIWGCNIFGSNFEKKANVLLLEQNFKMILNLMSGWDTKVFQLEKLRFLSLRSDRVSIGPLESILWFDLVVLGYVSACVLIFFTASPRLFLLIFEGSTKKAYN